MSTPSISMKEDFTQEEILTLEKTGVFLSANINGLRTVRASAFDADPILHHAQYNSEFRLFTATGNFHICGSPSTKRFSLPTSLETSAALEHIGFTAVAAKYISQDYNTRSNRDQSLIDFIYDHIRSTTLSIYHTLDVSDLPLREVMTNLGFNETVKDAVLDIHVPISTPGLIPFTELARIANPAGPFFSIEATLRTNYEQLCMIHKFLKGCAERSRTEGKGIGELQQCRPVLKRSSRSSSPKSSCGSLTSDDDASVVSDGF